MTLDIQIGVGDNNLAGDERWIGQIASEDSWKDNIMGYPANSWSEYDGWGERYRVHILGHNDDIKDPKQLPWAHVLYPVNAGGGPGGHYSPASMRQGTVVMGIWADGAAKQQPLIIGVLGYNQFMEVEQGSTAPMVPNTGFTSKDTPSGNIESNNTLLLLMPLGAMGLATLFNNQSKDETSNTTPQSAGCGGWNVGGMQNSLVQGIQKIQNLNKFIKDKDTGITNWGKDTSKAVDKQLKKISEDMKLDVGNAFESLEKGVLGEVDKIGTDVSKTLFPNQQEKLKKKIEEGNNLIACLFSKLIGSIGSNIFKILKRMLKKLINITQCVVETILATILGHFTSMIKNALSTVIGAITSITGGLVNLTGSVAKLLGRALSFLHCDVQPKCATDEQWDILVGNLKSTDDYSIQTIIKQANEVAASFKGGFDSIKDMADSITSGNPISDALDNAAKCYSGPEACGPPQIRIFGGGIGKGAIGNAIINSVGGEIMGVDLTQFGVNYNEQPFAIVYDTCGKGSGAVIEPVVDEIPVYEKPDGTWEDDQGRPIKDSDGFITGIRDIHGDLIRGEGKTLGIKSINVIQSGRGYLAAPDGSLGGDGRTWALPTDTIVHRDDGWDPPMPGGEVIEVDTGDTVTIPHGTTTNTISSVGRPDQMLMGGIPTLIDGPSTFTTPTTDYDSVRGSYPSDSSGSYPVVLYLCDVLVERRGWRYSPGDKVIISPNQGAEVEVTFDNIGQLETIKVIKSGEGFKEMPDMYIESTTGVGARLIPKFCIDRIGEDDIKSPDVEDKVISVVDCVGALTR